MARIGSRLRSLAAAVGLLFAAAPGAAQTAPGVLPTNFADPFVLPHGGRFLAYATNMYEDRANVPMAFSSDLVTWNLMAVPNDPDAFHDALPNLPEWAQRGSTWAPEVIRVGGRFVLYFTARHRSSGRQCIGAATAREPRGPFAPAPGEPIVCQRELGGTIDASPFRDSDGKLYLYFKNDGNAVRAPTQLWGQRLSDDGLGVAGEPVALARNDAPWEGPIVEAPFMVRRHNRYFLFFSANDYAWQERERLSRYATGYAVCDTPLGPCADAPNNPILASRPGRDCLSGPGHPAIFEANGRDYIAFHAWATRSGCRRGPNARYLHILPLDWSGGVPSVAASLR